MASFLPSTLKRSSRPSCLRDLYRAWLNSEAPPPMRAGRVAGEKIRRELAKGAIWERQTAPAWEAIQADFLQNPNKVWIWSDLHWFHRNIIAYSKRPFGGLFHMHETMVARAKERVAQDDWLLFLGDLSFGTAEETRSLLEAIPGRKALILGNHDVDRQEKTMALPQLGFEAIGEVQELALASPIVSADGSSFQKLWMTHYPLWEPWVPENTRNVHGHIHQNIIGGRCINASVEHTQYAPIRLLDLVTRGCIEADSTNVKEGH